MPTPDLSAKLPPPHDEEPAQLRSDILDELQDHLSCASDRERRRLQLSGQPVDPSTIWQSVIERFGDPSALARRLWLDAMQERLMTQRVLIGAVLALITLLMAAMWRMNTTLAATIDQNQKTTAAILERMAKETPSNFPEWIPVKYKLVQGSLDGPPVAGQEVALTQPDVNNPITHLKKTSGSDGIVDFGLVYRDEYTLNISSPHGELGEQATIRPGQPTEVCIVIPDPPKLTQVKFDTVFPDWKTWGWQVGFTPKGEAALLIRCDFKYPPDVTGRVWSCNKLYQQILVRSDGIYPMDSYQLPSSESVFISPSARMESVAFPAMTVELHGRWCCHDESSSNPSGRNLLNYQPVDYSMSQEFNNANRMNPAVRPFDFPIKVQIEQGVEEQVIPFPPVQGR